MQYGNMGACSATGAQAPTLQAGRHPTLEKQGSFS